MATHNQNHNQTAFLKPEQMAEYFPLLTVVFDVSSDVLQQTAMIEEDKQQFKLELETFYKYVMKHAPSFSENYDNLSDDEQEDECRSVGSFIYFASVLRMFAEKVAKSPISTADGIDFDNSSCCVH